MSGTVAVVIPAYNAAATIDATIASVRAQSHADLDIIVVDDGSTDATAAHVDRHAAIDPRIRMVRQDNAGVAAARNRGIAEARALFVAPIDADDLWRPTKIARQLAALAAAPRAALAYTWFAVIDEAGRVVADDNSSSEEGDVLRRMCRGNLVGNGSSPLIRREAVLAAGGYDSGLRAANAQGCEDLKLYLALAERHHFAVVREHLTGYRWTRANMSSDGMRMLRSYDMVMTRARARLGERYDADFAWGRAFIIEWLVARALRYGRPGDARRLIAALHAQDAAHARRLALAAPFVWLCHRFPPAAARRPFLATAA